LKIEEKLNLLQFQKQNQNENNKGGGIMNDVKIASDLARMSIGVMDTTAQIMQLLRALTLFYVEKMKDDRDRQLLLDFYGAGEKEIKLLREQNKKDGKNNPLTIKSYDINPSNLKILQSICKRDGIAYMINQISTTDLVPDGIGDSVQTGKFTMSVYSTRQQEFEAAIREAKIRSGQELEMDASYLIGPSNLREKDALQRKGVIFIDTQLASENPIKWMKEPIPEDKYVLMRQTIQKLPPEMRSTLIYRKLEDGTRQVGFLSKTEQLFDKKGNRYVEDRKYDATNIMKGVMASVNLQMRSKGIDDKLKNIENISKLKEIVIDKALKNEFKSKDDILNDLKSIKMDENDKKLFLSELNKKDFDIKKLKEIINKQDIKQETKDAFSKDLDLSKNELYIVPITINKTKDNKIEYTLNTKESICMDDKFTVRVQGLDDLVVKDRDSMKNNLDKKLTEFSEKDGNSFVVLTRNEFNALELADKKYMKTGKKLKNEKIKFMSENEDKYAFEQNHGITKEEFLANNILDQIHSKQERFLAISDNDYMSADEFLKDVNKTVVEVAAKEDEITNKVDENYQTVKNEVLQDIKDEEGEIVVEDQDLGIEIYNAFNESDELIGDKEAYVLNDSFDQYIKNEAKSVENSQKDLETEVQQVIPFGGEARE
jgi:hypothetical protein